MMDDIFNKIKQSFHGEKLPDMPLSAWDEFSSYKEKRDNPRKSPWLPITIAGLTALLFASNLFWWHNNSNTTMTSIVEKRDTIYITKYLNESTQHSQLQDDQIAISKEEYKSLLLNTTNLSNALNRVNDLSFQFDKLQQVVEANLLTTSGREKNKFNFSEPFTIQSTTSTAEQKELVKASRPSYTPFKELASLYPGLLEYTHDKHHFLNRSTKVITLDRQQSFWDRIKPKSISVYTQLGPVSIRNHGFGNSSGSSYGIGISTFFSKRFRAGLGMSYFKSRSEIREPELYPSLPTVVPPENSILSEVYINQRNISGQLSFDHLFKPIKQFRPYAGIVYTVGSSQYVNLEYEFASLLGEETINFGNLDSYTSQYLGVRLGTDINISQNFDASLGLSYLLNIAGESGNYIYVGPGLNYHF